MKLRQSLTSMLTALALLAVPVAPADAQAPAPVRPSAEAGALKVRTPVGDKAPEDAPRPATAGAASEPRSSSAGLSAERKKILENTHKKKVGGKDKKAQQKRDAAFRESQRQMQLMRMQMQMMMQMADRQLQLAMLEASRMEGIERREAEERMRRLETAASEARATEYQQEREYYQARDDPEQYRRFQEAQIEAQRAQQQAIQGLAEALRERQGGSFANSPPQSPGIWVGPPANSSPSQGSTGQPPMRSNPGVAVPMPSPPAQSQAQESFGNKDKRDQDAMRRRYP